MRQVESGPDMLRDGVVEIEFVALVVSGIVNATASTKMKLEVNGHLPREEQFS